MPTLLQVASQAAGGGLERLARSCAKEAASAGWRSVIAYYDGMFPEDDESIEYVRLPKTGVGRGWPGALRRLCNSLGPDIVHLHDPGPGSLGAIAVRSAGFENLIYSDHSVHALRGRRYRIARRATSRLPLVSVAVCRAVARSLVLDARAPADRVVVIRNGTEVAAPLPLPQPGAPPLVRYVANLWPWKGHETLIRAVRRLHDTGIPVVAELAGDGGMRPHLERLVRELRLSESVRFLGHVADPWVSAPHVYVHPSDAEGLPQAVLEAMMRGLPVIASDIGGVSEVLMGSETGLLIPVGDVGALARSIAGLLDDPSRARRLGASARRHVMAEWGIERALAGHMQLYRQVLAGEWA